MFLGACALISKKMTQTTPINPSCIYFSVNVQELNLEHLLVDDYFFLTSSTPTNSRKMSGVELSKRIS